MIDLIMMFLIALFYLIFIGRTVMLMLTGVSPFVIGAGKKGVERMREAGFLIGLLYWTFEIVRHACLPGFRLLPDACYAILFDLAAVRVVGLVLIAAAIVLFVAALVSFGASWRVGVDTRRPGNLVTAGVFRYSRNPIFVSLDAIFLGTFLVYSNLFFLIVLVLTVAGMHFQIRAEEKFLESRYGREYREYRRKVRRYL